VIDQAVKNVIRRATHKTIGAKIVARCSSLPGATEHVRAAASLAAPLAAGRENGANPDYSVFRRGVCSGDFLRSYFLSPPLSPEHPRKTPKRVNAPNVESITCEAMNKHTLVLTSC